MIKLGIPVNAVDLLALTLQWPKDRVFKTLGLNRPAFCEDYLVTRRLVQASELAGLGLLTVGRVNHALRGIGERCMRGTGAPVLYLDFDGVLHHENVLWHPNIGPYISGAPGGYV